MKSELMGQLGSAQLSPEQAAEVVCILEEYMKGLEEGNGADPHDLIARYPAYADVLQIYLDKIEVLHAAAVKLRDSAPPPGTAEIVAQELGQLGDFRIIRELGRGGMGVVYEAEQISLRRRVALKSLPFAAALDDRQLQRFKNEAQAAAHLHHTNIVPVFAVGQERGVHFYAMQLIEGETVADLIKQLRQTTLEAQVQTPASDQSVSLVANELLSGRWVQPVAGGGHNPIDSVDSEATNPYEGPAPGPARTSAESSTRLLNKASTQRSTSTPAYFRTVARLGIQASEALEHAHQMGVVHRDIKPGNLMVDVRGNLWVTDFGLAQIQNDTRLTMTGDLLGTLRYMSPEQALAKRVVVDHRTDLYSLGVTLYELLTLRPAVSGKDRQEILRKIAFDEPHLPRRWNKAVPTDLETIVLKAMAKNPQERYASAQEIADDLDRFLKDRPIRARRPTALQHVKKWARRHKPVVLTVSLFVAVAVVLTVAGLVWNERQLNARRAETENRINEALQHAASLHGTAKANPHELSKWAAAIGSAEKAQVYADSGYADEPLRLRVNTLLATLKRQQALARASVSKRAADLSMREKLISIREQDLRSDLTAAGFARTDRAFTQAFRDHGMEMDRLTVAQAADRIRNSAIHSDLTAALDIWASARLASRKEISDAPSARHLLDVARSVDADNPERNRLREALQAGDQKSVEELAASAPVETWSPITVSFLGDYLFRTGSHKAAARLLRKAVHLHPDDYWVNFYLGISLLTTVDHPTDGSNLNPRQGGEVFRYLTQVDEVLHFCAAARALRPKSYIANVNLGVAYAFKGHWDESIAAYQRAIEIDKSRPQAHGNLGQAFLEKKDFAKAAAACREAIRLDSEDIERYVNLAAVLRAWGKTDQAIVEIQKALKIQTAATRDADRAQAYCALGLAYDQKKEIAKAIESFEKAVKLKEGCADAFVNLSAVLNEQANRLKDASLLHRAVAALEKAVQANPKSVEAHNNLGVLNLSLGKLDEAISAFEKITAFKPFFAPAFLGIGVGHMSKKQPKPAIAAFRRAIQVDPKFASAYLNLGAAYRMARDLDKAIAVTEQAVEVQRRHGGNLIPKRPVRKKLITIDDADKVLPKAHFNLGLMHGQKGQTELSVAHFRKAVAIDPRYADAHLLLGNQLQRLGELQKALDHMEKAETLGVFDQPYFAGLASRLIPQCRRLIALDAKLEPVLSGKHQPAGAAERVAFAVLCRDFKRRQLAAAGFYKEAFALQPDLAKDLKAGHRFKAACAAVAAAGGAGVDAGKLDDRTKAGWREQARQWLRADTDQLGMILASDLPNNVTMMEGWLNKVYEEKDLAAIRDAGRVAKLPQTEQKACLALWLEIASLKQRFLLEKAKIAP